VRSVALPYNGQTSIDLHRNMTAPLTALLRYLTLLALLWSAVGPVHADDDREPLDEALRTLLVSALSNPEAVGNELDAEVWLFDMSSRLDQRISDKEKRLELLRHVYFEARRARLEPELVLAVIEVESNFDRFAVSKSGARGLMQIMPFWLKEIGRSGDDLFDAHTNLRFGCTILRYYLDMEKGNLVRALARYNGSLGKLDYPNRVLSALRRNWHGL